ncbi:GTP 3',8-cyclase MoaA [Tsuneonella suprasediminis]|uniref:GTP 3',8-cyclase n=1 Tax=Tsuneonella suprasediminis TaxID=2306996 RepID=A0A419QYK1_9SPHN|nr:GTP 3',8-cyclase MoaA [Tsuneonella suprasediminis]RJX65906.1 GTP 3',8-cyclase MoaA [Tsuneonella suprasediminis]
MLVDGFQRTISYLRLSITDRCDLRCAYCMPEAMRFLPRRDLLTIDELYKLAQGFIARGVNKIRITGGEPLVRRDAIDLITRLGQKLGNGLNELTVTTNGTQLAANAAALARAGVRRINVSLDTLDRETFATLTRRDRLPDVLAGIAAAKAAGLTIKINVVALKSVNESNLPNLIEWAHGEGHDVSLIEVMPLGKVDGDRVDHYLPLTEVRKVLDMHWNLSPSSYRTSGPARYFDVRETGGRIGFITPLTDNFCNGCNRIRVTSTGQLYPCLGGGERVDLRAALRSPDPQAALDSVLDEAMRIKPERHRFAITERGAAPAQARHMSVTGG